MREYEWTILVSSTLSFMLTTTLIVIYIVKSIWRSFAYQIMLMTCISDFLLEVIVIISFIVYSEGQYIPG